MVDQPMTCEFCGGETVKKRVRKVHWLRRILYIMDDVEAEVCRECGERYYHATTLDTLDQLLASGSLAIKERPQVQVMAVPA
ncbi:MAG: YgiT-type zinc finger protein [Chloroflexi bacterium]|nr:YgiT-type zinc finger protein [Chloroflexota bacterium]